MTTINQLSAVDTVSAGDLVPIFSTNNGDARKAAMSVIQSFILDNLVFPSTASLFPNYVTQYAAPSSDGFNVAINNNSNNTHLILTPTAGFATGTITLPAIANVIDKQEVLVNCTQQINALTINGNGATAVTGKPAVIAADDFFRLRFDLSTASWYRVG